MKLLRKMRERGQYAVYWGPKRDATTGAWVSDEYGQPLWIAPVELKVRWEDVVEIFLDRSGAQTVSNAKVFVGEDLDDEGVLWRGRLAAVPDAAVPLNNPRASQIRKFSNIPTLRNDDALRVAYL